MKCSANKAINTDGKKLRRLCLAMQHFASGYSRRSRRYAARMRKLTSSNAWPTPLRGANARVDFVQRLAHTAMRCEPTVGPAGSPA